VDRLTAFVLVLALTSVVLAQDAPNKCSAQAPTGRGSVLDICEILSKPEQYTNRLLTARARYLGNFESPAKLFGDECCSKSVGTADPEDLHSASMPGALVAVTPQMTSKTVAHSMRLAIAVPSFACNRLP
jgi:hypothetical protein